MKKRVLVGCLLLSLASLVLVSLPKSRPDLPASPSRPNEDRDCRVTGRILLPAGTPLPGARVEARALGPGVAWEAASRPSDSAGAYELVLFPPRGRWGLRVVSETGDPFAVPDVVTAAPGRVLRLDLTARPPPPPEAVPSGPNVGGEVSDRYGRLLTGIPVVVEAPGGATLGRAVTGEEGRFALHVRASPPFVVKIEGEDSGSEVRDLPALNLALIREGEPPARDRIAIRVDLQQSTPDVMARVTLYDSLGQRELSVHRMLGDSPYYFDHVPYGVYDVRVSTGSFAGAIQGFDFRPDHTTAAVPVGPGATVRGSVSLPARVLLRSESPTRVKLCANLRESDGPRGYVRGVWAGDGPWANRNFAYAGLPAGRYTLRVLRKDTEIVEIPLTLSPGEQRDLGEIRLVPATGVLRVLVKERPEGGPLRHGYRVIAYNTKGLSRTRTAQPGETGTVRFERLPAGDWFYRVERFLDRPGYTRYVGWDRSVPVRNGEETEVVSDCSWDFGGPKIRIRVYKDR